MVEAVVGRHTWPAARRYFFIIKDDKHLLQISLTSTEAGYRKLHLSGSLGRLQGELAVAGAGTGETCN